MSSRGTTSPSERGRLRPEYIRSTIREASPLVKECYDLALRKDPDLAGKLVASFTIAGEPGVEGLV